MIRKAFAFLPFFVCILMTSEIYSQEYLITGVKKCGLCHRSKKIGSQFSKWQATSHSHAFNSLLTDKAKDIGLKNNIKSPSASEKCLSCHSTIGFLKKKSRDSYNVNEGVGCESCHGAGSGYSALSIMRDREKALLKGMTPGDFKMCLQCHNNSMHEVKPFNNEVFWLKIKH